MQYRHDIADKGLTRLKKEIERKALFLYLMGMALLSVLIRADILVSFTDPVI